MALDVRYDWSRVPVPKSGLTAPRHASNGLPVRALAQGNGKAQRVGIVRDAGAAFPTFNVAALLEVCRPDQLPANATASVHNGYARAFAPLGEVEVLHTRPLNRRRKVSRIERSACQTPGHTAKE